MTASERRRPENAQLREKINHIQEVSRQLQTLVLQIQAQTIDWAREGRMDDLPNAELARHLLLSFKQQRDALAEIQESIKGAAVHVAAPGLITDEELAALMK